MAALRIGASKHCLTGRKDRPRAPDAHFFCAIQGLLDGVACCGSSLAFSVRACACVIVTAHVRPLKTHSSLSEILGTIMTNLCRNYKRLEKILLKLSSMAMMRLKEISRQSSCRTIIAAVVDCVARPDRQTQEYPRQRALAYFRRQGEGGRSGVSGSRSRRHNLTERLLGTGSGA